MKGLWRFQVVTCLAVCTGTLIHWLFMAVYVTALEHLQTAVVGCVVAVGGLWLVNWAVTGEEQDAKK